MNAVPYYNDPRYWAGELTWRPGYVKVPYQDFQTNQVKCDYILSKHPQGKVLDIGCAMGFLVRRLRAKGVDAYGIDISHYALEHAPAEVKPFLTQADVTQGLPFKDKEFDLVVSTGTFEHFEGAGLEKAVAEVERVGKRGMIAITLKGDIGAAEDPHHPTLKTLAEWRALFPPEFEVRSDANEEWVRVKEIHSVLVIAPVLHPCGEDVRYAGIERLAYFWSKALSECGLAVYVVGVRGSQLAPGVVLIEAPSGDFTQGDLVAYGAYKHLLSQFDLVLDFSHSHYAMREIRLPAVCWTWHDPAIMQPLLPLYNVCALSKWQQNRLFSHQRVNAKVLDSHCGRTFPPLEPEDYYVFIGRPTPTKGMLEAAQVCQKTQSRLYIIGALGGGDDPVYLERVREQCRNGVEYLGGVSAHVKYELLRKAKALLFPISYPRGSGEAHSHKTVDALLCGCPVIAYRQGALDEVVEDGVDGFLVNGVDEMIRAIASVDQLDRSAIQKRAEERWAPGNVVKRSLPLLTDVARGAAW